LGSIPPAPRGALWLETHPLGANKLAVVASDSPGPQRPTPEGVG
jgi:hypothetical protein